MFGDGSWSSSFALQEALQSFGCPRDCAAWNREERSRFRRRHPRTRAWGGGVSSGPLLGDGDLQRLRDEGGCAGGCAQAGPWPGH